MSPASTHLALFMTRGVSLAQWERQGLFEREVALYRALRSHLAGISFVTYGGLAESTFADRLPGIEILSNHWNLPTWAYAALLPRLHRRALAGATVLKTNQIKGAEAAIAAQKTGGARLIARSGYLWSEAAKQFNRGWRGRLNYRDAVRTERLAFGRADAISVTTSAARDFIGERYGIAAERIRVIPNYVMDTFFKTEARGGGTEPTIISVGRLEQDKNPTMLIEAARGLKAKVILIGQGSLRAKLERRAAEIGVKADFISAVPHRDLPGCLAACDVFVLSSPREGHPKTLIEAMACGLAVVGTNAPGIREVIRHGETGLLAENDPAAFREAMARLLADGELRARLGANAREYARAHFSFSKILEAELRLLSEVTERRNAG